MEKARRADGTMARGRFAALYACDEGADPFFLDDEEQPLAPPPDDRRLLSAAVTLALVAFVWPVLVHARAFRAEAAIGAALALAWAVLAAVALWRSGPSRLWLAMLLPFVVWWPLMFAFMAE